MIEDLWLGGASLVYASGVVVLWRMFAGHFAWKMARSYGQRKPDGSDWTMATLGGLGLGLLWPVVVVVAVVGTFCYRVLVPPARKALRPFAVGYEREELKQRRQQSLKAAVKAADEFIDGNE